MKFRSVKFLGLGVVVSLLLSAPISATAATADCEAAPSLLKVGSHTKLVGMPNGSTAGYYSFNAGVANPTAFPTRVSYVSANLDKYKIDSVFPGLGRSVAPLTLAGSRPTSIGYINTDFFDTGNNMPASAIIRDSRLIYAPPGRTKVLGIVSDNTYEATGYPTPSTFSSGAVTFILSGVNLPAVPASGALVATPKAASRTIAKGSYGVLIVNKKITALYPKGTTKRPTTGLVIQANGAAATKLKKLKVGAKVSYTLPAAPSFRLVGDAITPTGYVQAGSARISITAVNYLPGVSSGAVLYDNSYSPSVSQWLGVRTLLLDATGKVVSYYSRGRNVTPTAAYPYVLQLASDAVLSLASAPPVKDAQYTIVNRYSSSGKFALIASVGRGNKMLTAGANVEECNYSTEQIRPRSVIGWNKNGQIWIMSSTMGQNYEDNMYRQGGSTLHQMAEWLKELGASEAYAFDGGGSTNLYANYGFGLSRIDLPATAWERNAPVGLVILPSN
jgi:hypothetical protein